MKEKRISSILRALVGVYLLYLSYDLLDQFHFEKLEDNLLSSGFGFLYLVAGIALLLWGGLGYISASKHEKSKQ